MESEQIAGLQRYTATCFVAPTTMVGDAGFVIVVGAALFGVWTSFSREKLRVETSLEFGGPKCVIRVSVGGSVQKGPGQFPTFCPPVRLPKQAPYFLVSCRLLSCAVLCCLVGRKKKKAKKKEGSTEGTTGSTRTYVGAGGSSDRFRGSPPTSGGVPAAARHCGPSGGSEGG